MPYKKQGTLDYSIGVMNFDKFITNFDIANFGLSRPKRTEEPNRRRVKRRKENYERFRRVDSGEAPLDSHEVYQYEQGRAYTGRDYGGYYRY